MNLQVAFQLIHKQEPIALYQSLFYRDTGNKKHQSKCHWK